LKIKTIDIPSIGKRYDITTESNSKFVLIDYFSGFKEIYILKDNQTIGPIKLNSDEANQLAILLSRVLKEFLEKRIDVIFQNLAIETIKIEEDFKSINKTIEELKFRTITQTYIIAIIRDEKPIVMPKPEEKILENDVLVLLGSIEDIEKAKIYLKNLRA
jgi:K+/H+ antiporter YhaU regulatory subunit KhtT